MVQDPGRLTLRAEARRGQMIAQIVWRDGSI
jgi:hypothetical protein